MVYMHNTCIIDAIAYDANQPTSPCMDPLHVPTPLHKYVVTLQLLVPFTDFLSFGTIVMCYGYVMCL